MPEDVTARVAVTWTVTTADSPWLKLLAYVPIAVLEGLFIALLSLLAWALVTAPTVDPALLAVVALFGLVGGPLSLLYLLPMIRDPAQRPTVPGSGPILEGLGLGPALVAGLLGAGGWLVAFATAPRVGFGIGVIGASLAVLTLSLVVGRGRVDPAGRRLAVGERTLDLDGLTGVATHGLGPWVLLRPQFAPGSTRLGSPWLVVVPRSRVEAVLTAIDAAVDQGSTDANAEGLSPDAGEPDRLVRGVLGLAGIAFLVVAGLAAVLDGEPLVLEARVAFVGVSLLLGLGFLAGARAYA